MNVHEHTYHVISPASSDGHVTRDGPANRHRGVLGFGQAGPAHVQLRVELLPVLQLAWLGLGRRFGFGFGLGFGFGFGLGEGLGLGFGFGFG